MSIIFECMSIRHGGNVGLYSLSGQTSYRKISWSLELVKSRSREIRVYRLFQLLWNLMATSAAAISRCLSNFRAIRLWWHPNSWLRDFTRFGGKASYRLVNRDPAAEPSHHRTLFNGLVIWGLLIYICVIIHSCNNLAPVWCQAITWRNDDLLLIVLEGFWTFR